MKAKEVRRELTNIFEIALHQEFRKLQLGEPDKKVRKAIDKASKKVTSEVKRFMKEKQKVEEKRKKLELKKMRQGAKNKKGSSRKPTTRPQTEIVEDIMA